MTVYMHLRGVCKTPLWQDMKPLAWREAYRGADNVWQQSRDPSAVNICTPLPGLRAALPVTGLVVPPSLKLMTLGDSRSDLQPCCSSHRTPPWDSHGPPPLPGASFRKARVDRGYGY